MTHQEVIELRKVADQWQAWAGERLLASAPVVILAAAAEVRRFDACAGLPLKRIRGQITRLPATVGSRALRTVVCAEGYVAPPRGDEHTWARALISTVTTWRRRWPNTRATWRCWTRYRPTWHNAWAWQR